MGTHTKAISAGGGISRGAPLEIPEDVAAAFANLPPARTGGMQPSKFTPAMDAMLLKHWPRADKREVSRVFKECFGFGCRSNLSRRYKELTN